ncbi:MAG: NUDIX domain-containing protein [Chloroflexi bacterium]|nr:NUDIX domain-containing protein [Chloroflexota bacterium]
MEGPTEYVECRTLYGDSKLIPTCQLQLRASAYGVILHEDCLLLIRGRHTQRYAFPGGGVDVGERLELALKREVLEETGIEVEIKRFLHFHEDFFYYDPLALAFHGLLFYYWCVPLTFDLVDDALVDDDDDAEQPRWIPISGLSAEAFQAHGEFMMKLLRMVQAAQNPL